MTTMTAERPKSNIADWLTVERLLFGAILLIGAFVRLLGLADQPLSPVEAVIAWPAWLRAMGLDAPVDAAPASALLFSLQTLSFWLTGGGDGIARFVTAVAGIALVWLPWLWRGWLGRTTALAVALLVAVDPWLVAFSRYADGTSLALLFFALALTALMRLHRDDSPARRRDWMLLAVAGGLLLVSGPLAWSTAPILLLFVWRYGWPKLAADPAVDGEDAGDGRQMRVTLILLFVGSALLGSTAWLSNPQGLAHVGGSLASWLGLFNRGVYPLSWALMRMAADQLLLLVMGAVGLVLLWRGAGPAVEGGGKRWATFLVAWLVWGIVLLLLPGRTPDVLPVLGGALIFAVGYTLGALVERVPPALDWREAAIAMAVFSILLISITFWGRILLASSQLTSDTLAIAALLLASLALVLAFYAVWAGWQAALWLGGVLAAGLLLASSVSNLWQLSHVHDVAMPDGLFAETTHPDVRLLADDVATISAQRIGDAGEIPVQVQMASAADPVLGWYLRDLRRLSWVLAPAVDEFAQERPLAITLGPSLMPTSAPAEDYMGGAYDVRVSWLPSTLWAAPVAAVDPAEQSGRLQRLQQQANVAWRHRLRPSLRWLVYSEVESLPTTDDAVLWAPVESQ